MRASLCARVCRFHLQMNIATFSRVSWAPYRLFVVGSSWRVSEAARLIKSSVGARENRGKTKEKIHDEDTCTLLRRRNARLAPENNGTRVLHVLPCSSPPRLVLIVDAVSYIRTFGVAVVVAKNSSFAICNQTFYNLLSTIYNWIVSM